MRWPPLLVLSLVGGCIRSGYLEPYAPDLDPWLVDAGSDSALVDVAGPADASSAHDRYRPDGCAAERDASVDDGHEPDSARLDGAATEVLIDIDAAIADVATADVVTADTASADAATADVVTADAATADVLPGLVVAYPMTDDPGDGMLDVSGSASVTTCSACPTQSGGAYLFTGSEYIEITPDPRFETAAGFTVAIWAKPSRAASIQCMVNKLYGTGVANSWQLSARTAASCGEVFHYETTNGSGYQAIVSPTTVLTDRWWHVAGTWDGATKNLYVNGALVATTTEDVLMDGSPIRVGADWDSGAPRNYFAGLLRDLRLFDRALEPAEVALLSAGTVFEPAPSVPGQVIQLVLVDAATDLDLGVLLADAAIAVPAGGISIRAEVAPPVGSVRFGLDGNADYRVESSAPYSLTGDTAGDYNPWNPAAGPHTVTVTPYCESGAAGPAGPPFTVAFTTN